MLLRFWLHGFRNNRERGRTTGLPIAAERMEDRTLLSVAALFVNGELFVGSDGGDSITIRQNTNARVEVLANGVVLGNAPNVLTSAVTKIVVKGGDEGNVIDLNQVTNATYPNLTSILVDSDDGADVITGSPTYGDSVQAGDGNDIILGQGGNDTLDGQAGIDSVNGEAGDDSLIGGGGADSLSGGVGNDTVNGNAGNDSIFGNEGNDSLIGGSDNDTLDGFLGDDTIRGQGGADSLFGGGGADSLDGGDGNDLVDAGDPLPEQIGRASCRERVCT